MFEKLRRRQVLGAAVVCGGLSLAAVSFCVGVAGANSIQPASAEDPFVPWVGDPALPLVIDGGSMLPGPF